MDGNAQNPIEELVHLYVDGAFSRRELMERVTQFTGGITATLAALAALGVSSADEANAQQTPGPQVPEGTPGIATRSVTYVGEATPLFGYLAYPDPLPSAKLPGVLVVHENRGLTDYIKDVTRRVAVAGYVGLGVDLLSRQGGTDKFTDATSQQQAYSRTTQYERRSDLIYSLDYLKHVDSVKYNRIGMVGFCAGGGNVWDFVVNVPELSAAVAFYGTPTPPLDQIVNIQTPVLANYAELDRTLSLQMPAVITAMLTQQKTFSFRLYQGVGHAFHNDTGPNYNAVAATDAWNQTIAFFNKFLNQQA